MKKAPIAGVPEKYLKDENGKYITRGKNRRKVITPEWQKLQDMNKAIVESNVKPKIPKRKIR